MTPDQKLQRIIELNQISNIRKLTLEERKEKGSLSKSLGHLDVPKSVEHRRKISESHKGRKASEETKKKMSRAHKGFRSFWLGKKHTDEYKKKMSEATKGIPKTLEHNRKNSEGQRRRVLAGLRSKYSRVTSMIEGVTYKFRSTWENDVAKWMTLQNWNWTYEEKGYRLSNNRVYIPDFHIYKNEQLWKIVEVKGYMDRYSEEKIRLFKQDYSEILFEVWDWEKCHELNIW